MANIEINLTLEGEEALRVLQAILNKGAEVSVTQHLWWRKPPNRRLKKKLPRKNRGTVDRKGNRLSFLHGQRPLCRTRLDFVPS